MDKMKVLNGEVEKGDLVDWIFQGDWQQNGIVYSISHSGRGEVLVQAPNGAKYHKNPQEVMLAPKERRLAHERYSKI